MRATIVVLSFLLLVALGVLGSRFSRTIGMTWHATRVATAVEEFRRRTGAYPGSVASLEVAGAAYDVRLFSSGEHYRVLVRPLGSLLSEPLDVGVFACFSPEGPVVIEDGVRRGGCLK